MPRGRPPKVLDSEESLRKQQKNHEYYLKFKNKHPGYYKKEKVEKDDEVDEDVQKEEKIELNNKTELLDRIDNMIQNLNALQKLIHLKNLYNNII